LASGGWDRKPQAIHLNPDQTETRNVNCFLERFGGCSDAVSKEHFISDAVLRAMVDEADDNLVQVRGHPWTDGSSFKGVGAGALTAKILCTSHNNCLSPLDNEALHFWQAVRGMTRLGAQPRQLVLLNGHDIERWVFKLLCGQLIAGVSRCEDGSRVTLEWFPTKQLELIASLDAWTSFVGCGLYYLSTAERHLHTPAVGFRAVVSEPNRAVLGARIGVCGLDFLLAVSSNLDPAYPHGAEPKYRPGGFRFTHENGPSDLLFSWNDDEPHPMITLRNAGQVFESNYPHSRGK
jgi:hypothetical protein